MVCHFVNEVTENRWSVFLDNIAHIPKSWNFISVGNLWSCSWFNTKYCEANGGASHWDGAESLCGKKICLGMDIQGEGKQQEWSSQWCGFFIHREGRVG